MRAAAVGQREVRVHGAVDAGGGQLRLGTDDPRARGEQPQETHRVAPHVHGGAAGQRELVADVALLPQRRREGDVDVRDVAELARADDLDQSLREGVVLVVEGLHDHQTGVAVDHLSHARGLVGVGREGLLAQDVLAGPQRGDRPVAVQPVREWVVDRVDVGVGDQFGVGVHDTRNALLAGEFLGPVAVAGRHRRDGGAAGPAGRLHQGCGGDASRPQDPDPQHAVIGPGGTGPGQ